MQTLPLYDLKEIGISMKTNIDRISLLAAGAVLAAILLFLSITYLQKRTEEPLEQGTAAEKAENAPRFLGAVEEIVIENLLQGAEAEICLAFFNR